MQPKKLSRKMLIEQISALGRKMSTTTIIFHQAVAESAGMSGTDHKYLDLLFQEGSMPAGRLAELTGLTTGAVTGIIDRLEKQGLVERVHDKNDRRKVLVVPKVEKAMERLGPIFKSLETGLMKIYEKYSDKELGIILSYLQDSTEFFRIKTDELKKK